MKRVSNPLLPMEWHIPDPEAHVMSDGKLYVYGSCDKNKDVFCSKEYFVAHTIDLIDWEISGPIFNTEEVSWKGESKEHSSLSNIKSFDDLPMHIKQYMPEGAREIPIEQIIKSIEENTKKGLPKETLLYAPDAIEKNNKYYLYMCLSDDSEGVAVADSPKGPFTNAKQLPIDGIDPAVFVDDDGQGYIYWGQFKGNVAKLNEDMMSIDMDSIKENIVTEELHNFHEGSSVRKRGDIYYLVFADSSRGKPTCLGYATSKSPLGPFEYKGVIIDNAKCDPNSWNNHGSIEEFNGKWYIFYHRSSCNSDKMRRLCAEQIEFCLDGTISEVKMTSQGVGEPFSIGEVIPAYLACEVFGGTYIDLIDDKYGLVIPNIECCAYFRYVKNEKLIKSLVLDGVGSSKIEVWIDDRLVGQGQINDKKIDLEIETGLHEIKLVFKDVDDARLYSLTFE